MFSYWFLCKIVKKCENLCKFVYDSVLVGMEKRCVRVRIFIFLINISIKYKEERICVMFVFEIYVFII